MATYKLEDFGKAFVPKKLRPGLHKYLNRAGIEEVPYKFFGMLFLATIVITYLIFVPGIYPMLKGKGVLAVFAIAFLSWAVIQIICATLIILGVYFYLNIKIYTRTKELEDLLPDYLSMVSTNLKGGMSFERALWAAIKPEFGILSKEVGIVSKKVATGNDITDALQEFADKYDSPVLKRSIDLLKGEILSGGSVSHVLDSIVINLKRTKSLRQEMVASTLTYMIFMAAIVVVIMPILFALSKQLLTILLNFSTKLSGSLQNTSVSGFNFSPASIDPFYFEAFSLIAIAIISVFSSMIISTIEKGDVKSGLKYIPLFLFGSIIMYFIFSTILETLMKGLIF